MKVSPKISFVCAVSGREGFIKPLRTPRRSHLGKTFWSRGHSIVILLMTVKKFFRKGPGSINNLKDTGDRRLVDL